MPSSPAPATLVGQLIHPVVVGVGVVTSVLGVLLAMGAAATLCQLVGAWPADRESVWAVPLALGALLAVYSAVALISVYLYLEIFERSWWRLGGVAFISTCNLLCAYWREGSSILLPLLLIGSGMSCLVGGVLGEWLRRRWRASRARRVWRSRKTPRLLRQTAYGLRLAALASYVFLLCGLFEVLHERSAAQSPSSTPRAEEVS